MDRRDSLAVGISLRNLCDEYKQEYKYCTGRPAEFRLREQYGTTYSTDEVSTSTIKHLLFPGSIIVNICRTSRGPKEGPRTYLYLIAVLTINSKRPIVQDHSFPICLQVVHHNPFTTVSRCSRSGYTAAT